MEYYNFSQDQQFLTKVAYPAMRSVSVFYSKALTPFDDLLLIQPSASPEQRHNGNPYATQPLPDGRIAFATIKDQTCELTGR